MDLQQLFQKEGKQLIKKKHEHVFMQGDHDYCFYFVQSGLLKGYYTLETGKEFIKSFVQPQDIIGSLSAVYLEKASTFSLRCLEETTLLEIPYAVLARYGKQYHCIANDIIDLLLKFALKKEQREFEFLCLSAQERYALLLNSSPQLLARVTQNDIAAYLGVTPVGLSRIKQRLTHQVTLT